MADLSKIRNFCIIAHIDHGKSTLADRLIESTGAVATREIKDRMLDTLELEQERGITIKLQTARLKYQFNPDNIIQREKDNNLYIPEEGEYVLNLIDTPGHVDFSYEVSRSVAASEGALLLVDATQGVQAQTLTTVYKAMEYNLHIIPIINKVDMDIAEVEKTKIEMMEIFGFKEEEIILASGKSGIGIKEILDAIVVRIPPYNRDKNQIYTFEESDFETVLNSEKSVTKALIFDAFFHEYKGVTALVKIVSGSISKGDKLYLLGTETKVEPVEIGYLTPKMIETNKLFEGEVGYISTGLKDIHKVHAGDTITQFKNDDSHILIQPLKGYKQPKPMVYASLYPVESDDFMQFKDAIEKLSLNDAALTYQKEYSQVLGTGYVCGFLGLLHLEITQDRLEREHGIDLISTSPSVEFKVLLGTKDYSKVPNINTSNIDPKTNMAFVRTAAEFPEGSFFEEVYEPWVKLDIISPEEFVGPIMELAQKCRGVYRSMSYLSKGELRHANIIYEIPTLEIIVNFFDKLKSLSHGYASMEYSFLEYRRGDIVKVSLLVNNEPAESLSFLTHRNNAQRRGREMVSKLKELIPRQQFKVPIQAAIGSQVIARETIDAYRKDVLAKLYGGDITRKLKLLEKQKKGKKKMKAIGNVEIPKEAFMAALRIE